MRLAGILVVVAAVIAVAAYFGARGDGDGGTPSSESLGPQVAYSQVQGVFDEYGCVACHPGVNPSLDLTAERSYEQLVGIQALEDPTLYRVVAGDPGRSFLY